jgi:UMF1 family MFS transporter
VQPAISENRTVWSWALYDFANSPFTTLVITFVYATFFTQAIADDPISGTALWGRAITITALVVAFCSPALGAFADRGGYRKRFLLISTAVAVAGTLALYRVLPGQVTTALVIVVIANIAFEFGTVFYNAFLPDVAPPGKIGAVSGLGWGLGYIGGLLALGLALIALIRPDVPWFGFAVENGENIRATNLLVAVWFVVFSIPLFLWVPEDKSRASRRGHVLRETVTQLRTTFTEIRRHRQTARFLIARLIYNDGLVTIFAFGGIYAAGTFGFTLEQVLLFGIVINLAAGLGAIPMGYLDDRIGAKRTIILSLAGLLIASCIAILTTSQALFWFAGVMVGVFAGPNQSASRSLMGRFVPPDLENEFFGFFAFSGKLTAFVGPFALSELTDATGSQRIGVSVVVVLFVLGLGMLLSVDESKGLTERKIARSPAGAR